MHGPVAQIQRRTTLLNTVGWLDGMSKPTPRACKTGNCLTSCSAGAFVVTCFAGAVLRFFIIFNPMWGKDELQTLRCAIMLNGSMDANGGHAVTEEGRHVTDDYGAVRRRLLIQAVAGVPGFSERLAEATRALSLLSGIHEETSRVAATHRRS